MGDTFSNISNATIINRSIVEKATLRAESWGGQPASDALRDVTHHVEQSGNREAAELLAQFTEELSHEAPRKSLLKRSWEGLIATLPAITSMAEATEAVTKLFS